MVITLLQFRYTNMWEAGEDVSITSFRQSGKRQRQLSKLIRFIIAIFMILFALFPVLWTISASLDSTGSLATHKN